MKSQLLIAITCLAALFASGAPTILFENDFDTHLAKTPNQASVFVMGWDGFDGRYTCLKYFKVEYAAPEPGMIALLALFGLAFLRRK